MAIRNFAQEAFSSDNDGLLVPRQKFNFTLLLERFDRSTITFTRVSSVSAPGYTMDNIIMNQYNKKRVVQTKLNYDPITVAFYDTFDNEWHNLMRDYIAHYYNGTNGIAERTLTESNSTVNDNFETDLGYTPVGTAERYFFPQIKIIQNGYRNKYRETILKNPIITAIQGDQLDYSESTSVMYTVTFQPEDIQTLDVAKQFDSN